MTALPTSPCRPLLPPTHPLTNRRSPALTRSWSASSAPTSAASVSRSRTRAKACGEGGGGGGGGACGWCGVGAAVSCRRLGECVVPRAGAGCQRWAARQGSRPCALRVAPPSVPHPQPPPSPLLFLQLRRRGGAAQGRQARQGKWRGGGMDEWAGGGQPGGWVGAHQCRVRWPSNPHTHLDLRRNAHTCSPSSPLRAAVSGWPAVAPPSCWRPLLRQQHGWPALSPPSTAYPPPPPPPAFLLARSAPLCFSAPLLPFSPRHARRAGAPIPREGHVPPALPLGAPWRSLYLPCSSRCPVTDTRRVAQLEALQESMPRQQGGVHRGAAGVHCAQQAMACRVCVRVKMGCGVCGGGGGGLGAPVGTSWERGRQGRRQVKSGGLG